MRNETIKYAVIVDYKGKPFDKRFFEKRKQAKAFEEELHSGISGYYYDSKIKMIKKGATAWKL